jgi:hypothetical protein
MSCNPYKWSLRATFPEYAGSHNNYVNAWTAVYIRLRGTYQNNPLRFPLDRDRASLCGNANYAGFGCNPDYSGV